MGTAKRLADWLESHWVAPAYSGWLLSGLSIFFFLSATNTLSGWLYVMSGISFALLAIAAVLPGRTLRGIRVQRCSIEPVTVGDQLRVELVVENRTARPKALIQVQDLLPFVFNPPVTVAIESLAPQSSYRWVYHQLVERRGIYRWQTVNLRTAAPLGLFWCRRAQSAAAIAVVYPTVLPLTRCPLVDEIGQDTSLQFSRDRRAQTASEGLTRSLRPYRWGDPIRLVHWRTSARYGELRVRELEVFTSGQELVICLDSAMPWHTTSDALDRQNHFEQAVIAAASLYFYASHRHFSVKLWTAGSGLVQGSQTVLETLAAVQPGETVTAEALPTAPLLWLTSNLTSLSTLPPGSRWVLWLTTQADPLIGNNPGILIRPDQSLPQQLQGGLEKQLELE